MNLKPNTPPIEVSQYDQHIELWEMNRPEQRNPISAPEMIDALVNNIERINRDPGVRAVILHGKGAAFSAGGNVKDMQHRRGMFAGTPAELRTSYQQGIQRIPRALHDNEVPLIAAINGPAVGAGTDLALMCDLRVMAQQAWLAESFVTLGLIPGDGGAWLLTRNLSPVRAAEMLLTGEPVRAEKALEWGLVNQVVGQEQLLAAAGKLARRVAQNPPQAVRMAKRLMRQSQQQSLPEVLEVSAAMQALAHHSDEHHAALEAMLERRS